jgi:hypothetical protein
VANIKRLVQLRRVVEAAPEDRLHMRTWCESAACGTAYCAAGWAAIDPWFREHTEIETIFNVWDSEDGEVMVHAVADRNVCHDLAHFFGIDEDDANNLFAAFAHRGMDPHAISRAEVLGNIDALLEGGVTEPYDALRVDEEDEEDDD